MRKSLLTLLLLTGLGLVYAQAQGKEGLAAQQPIDGIALKSIDNFLLNNRIIDHAEQIQAAPYILAGDNERVLSGMGDRVFARGPFSPDKMSYGIFRQGKSYVDPDTQELLGINADAIGNAHWITEQGGIATFEVTRSNQEVRPGDRLMRSEASASEATFSPRAPSAQINAVIIDVPRGVTQVAQYDVVTLNKGRRDGLREGHVLAVYGAGETVRDRVSGEQIKIPGERSGLLMVFRTYEKLSYGLVLNASHSLAVMDKVCNP
ncbi:hypothetical protein D3C76_999340 [compost metagenome]